VHQLAGYVGFVEEQLAVELGLGFLHVRIGGVDLMATSRWAKGSLARYTMPEAPRRVPCERVLAELLGTFTVIADRLPFV